MMLSPNDDLFLKEKNISQAQLEEQLQFFVNGFPLLKVIDPVVPGRGLLQISSEELPVYFKYWDTYLNSDHVIVKFVPASGAASRMFKQLFEFLDGEVDEPDNYAVKEFFERITQFAFYDVLNASCIKNTGKNLPSLLLEGKYKAIIDNLLQEKGLNYGALPKGLLLFHQSHNETRTPVQEHLAEGVLYAMNRQKIVHIHFTVSANHKELFQNHIAAFLNEYEDAFDAKFDVGFSEQKSTTDTIAVDANNQPFRENGQLLFRPGGHGALIENLNDLNADIVFIKNIDNVVPDALKNPTVIYKKMLAGILVNMQQKAFAYLQEMDQGLLSEDKLREIADFCEKELQNIHPGIADLHGNDLQHYLYTKLNRPIRVCGMVKNTGEPGGGPYLALNPDGTISPQILESSQMNTADDSVREKVKQSTHFNPVDLVCGLKNYRGEKFDLLRYVDKNTGFISSKSKNGKAFKALELPGLWNGAMSDWNSIFVDVPVSTFNPVKTVNDLLRVEHQ